MVGDWQLALDSASNVVSLALPAGLWALLFALAWERPAFAESIGFGRTVFWLLLPGALLASFAILPIAPLSYDWLAIGFGGALLPLLVGGYAVRRFAPPAGRSLARYVGFVAVEATAMLFVVVPSSARAVAGLGAAARLGPGGASILLVGAIGLGVTLVAAGTFRGPDGRTDRRFAGLAGLSTGVLVLTFAGSSAVPGVGIVESFPYYLLAPVAAGVGAVLLAPRLFPGEEALALPTAYLGATVGCLVGADVLREPPLYGHGAAGLYVIGGAGVLDLVYLSGLLALGAALATHVWTRRGWRPVGPPTAGAPESPVRALRAAYRAGVSGDIGTSLRHSVDASRTAASEARSLLGLPAGAPDRLWDGLPIPGWIVSDQANLESVARSGTTDTREGFRAWLTARWLVVVGHELGLRRLASVGERLLAFGLDLALVSAPALLVLGLLVRATPGGYDAVAASVAFNTAIVGFVAVGLLYFAAAEAIFGTTVGKSLLRLGVRDRALRPPDGLAALARNLPLAPVLTLVGIGGGVALAAAIKGFGGGATSLLGVSVPAGVFAGLGIFAFVLGGIALLGSFGVVAIAMTWDRQRLGDLWAGTWVVRDATGAVAEPPPVPPGPSGVPPSG
jgi:uncharacterized membrane protein/uncharacterized RDD family membrane protein YckC